MSIPGNIQEMQSATLANLLYQADHWLTVAPSPPALLKVPGGYGDPSGHDQAMQPLVWDSQAALATALAWRLTGNIAYADHCAQVLTAWFTTLKEVQGFDSNLALVTKGLAFLEAWEHLVHYSWDGGPMVNLVKNLYYPAAQALISHPNNPGAWGWCGLIMADRFCGKDLLPRVDGFLGHLEKAVNLDTGDLWREDRRTNSGLWYTSWALEAYTKGLFLFQQLLSQDFFYLLWPAYQRLAEFVLHPETWPHPLPHGPWGLWGKLWQLCFPCAGALELPVPGRWPSGLLDTLLARGKFYPPWLAGDIATWLAPAGPINEGDAFRFSTVKHCFGLEP